MHIMHIMISRVSMPFPCKLETRKIMVCPKITTQMNYLGCLMDTLIVIDFGQLASPQFRGLERQKLGRSQ